MQISSMYTRILMINNCNRKMVLKKAPFIMPFVHLKASVFQKKKKTDYFFVIIMIVNAVFSKNIISSEIKRMVIIISTKYKNHYNLLKTLLLRS